MPDPASVGQHVADAAAEMARRGYRTIVYASARGYDDPSKVYPSRELRGGVDIRRLPLSSFGKSSITVRVVAQWIFLIQATVRGLFTRRLCGVMTSTSPPFCGIAGAIISKLRGVSFKYWLMDLNPDQMVAMGILAHDSVLVRAFDALNRLTLRRATDVVVLDRYMEERLRRKLDIGSKVTTIPPWPHEHKLGSVDHRDNDFRCEHVPPDRFVVMYSGNHSPANPISTVLEAAARMQGDPRLLMLCVGGGSGKEEVERMIASEVKNLRSLPYQPFDQIRYSLSAADVHVVSIGNDMVGIVHPCKVYGAMAVSRPIMLLGPKHNHVSDLVDRYKIGWHVEHGDVDAAQRALEQMLGLPVEDLEAMGSRATAVVGSSLSRAALLERFCDALQRGLPAPELEMEAGIQGAPRGRSGT